MDYLISALVMGVGATLVVDLWVAVRRRVLGACRNCQSEGPQEGKKQRFSDHRARLP